MDNVQKAKLFIGRTATLLPQVTQFRIENIVAVVVQSRM